MTRDAAITALRAKATALLDDRVVTLQDVDVMRLSSGHWYSRNGTIDLVAGLLAERQESADTLSALGGRLETGACSFCGKEPPPPQVCTDDQTVAICADCLLKFSAFMNPPLQEQP